MSGGRRDAGAARDAWRLAVHALLVPALLAAFSARLALAQSEFSRGCSPALSEQEACAQSLLEPFLLSLPAVCQSPSGPACCGVMPPCPPAFQCPVVFGYHDSSATLASFEPYSHHCCTARQRPCDDLTELANEIAASSGAIPAGALCYSYAEAFGEPTLLLAQDDSGPGCTFFCGDGVRYDPGQDGQSGTPDDEECDDGDSIDTNRCSNTCKWNPTPQGTAYILDTYSTGSHFVAGGAAGATATAPCGPTCLGGSREVRAGPGCDALLDVPPGVAQAICGPAGGQVLYTHMQPGTDLTLGGTATHIELQFTQIPAAGGSATVELQYGSSAVEEVSLGLTDYLVSIPLSGFSGPLVDVDRIRLRIDIPSSGVVRLDRWAVATPTGISGPAPASFAVSDSSASGTPYPSDPAGFQAEFAGSPAVAFEVRILDASDGAVQFPAAIGLVPSVSGDEVFWTQTLSGIPGSAAQLAYTIEFRDPTTLVSLSVSNLVSSCPTVTHCHADYEVATPSGGTFHGHICTDVPIALTQSANIASFGASPGSLEIDVGLTSVDQSKPVLQLLLQGNYTPGAAPPPAVPTLAPSARFALAALLLAALALLAIAMPARKRAPR